MAGYIGSKSMVTQVDGYNRTEADAEFLNDPASVITVSGSNVGIGQPTPQAPLNIADGSNELVRLQNTAAGGSSGYISFYETGDTRVGFIGYSSSSSNNLQIKNESVTGTVQIKTNDIERMRVDAGGNVGVNTITPEAKLHVNGDFRVGNPADNHPANNATGSGLTIQDTGKISVLGDSDWSLGVGRHTTTGQVAYFYYDATIEGNISVTASGTTYNTTSDYRLKENVTAIQGAADVVMAMQPCTYTAKADGLWYDGFLAHELQEVHPRAVTGTKDAVDEDGNPVMQSVDYSKLTPILTAALQEALTEIAALKVRVAALEVTP